MKLPDQQEQRLQEEIRRRILKAAKQQEDEQFHFEETNATLDALEEIVDLPREEMERIAKETEEELNQQEETQESSQPSSTQLLSHCIPILLIIVTFLLLRKGTWLYLPFAGATLISIYWNWRNRRK